MREDGLFTIKIYDLFIEFAKEEAQTGRYEDRHFLYHVGRTDVLLKHLKRLFDWWEDKYYLNMLARLVIRNSDLRCLSEEDLLYCYKVEVLQISDCKLLEEVDVQLIANLRCLEISRCLRLGQKFKGIKELTNLVSLIWKDLPRSSPVICHLSSLKSLQECRVNISPANL